MNEDKKNTINFVRTFGLGAILILEQDKLSVTSFHFDKVEIESKSRAFEGVKKLHDDKWIQKSIELWSSYYNENLSTADVVEISHNMVGFFSLLKKWDDDAKQQIRNCV